MSEEIWKPVVGYSRRYMVSNHGRIKSLKRMVKFGRYAMRICHEKILKPSFAKGYYKVQLNKNWG